MALSSSQQGLPDALGKAGRDIEERYLGTKRPIKTLFDLRLTGQEREVNSHTWHLLCHINGGDPRLYLVNGGKFIYDMTPQELAELT